MKTILYNSNELTKEEFLEPITKELEKAFKVESGIYPTYGRFVEILSGSGGLMTLHGLSLEETRIRKNYAKSFDSTFLDTRLVRGYPRSSYNIIVIIAGKVKIQFEHE